MSVPAVLHWRYVPRSGKCPAHLIAGPVPLGAGETRSERATCAWIWERIGDRCTACVGTGSYPISDSIDPKFWGKSCATCGGDGFLQIATVKARPIDEPGSADIIWTVTGIRPARDEERPCCVACFGGGMASEGDCNGPLMACPDCGGTGREPGMWIVGELP